MNNCGTIILKVPHSHSADLLCNDMVRCAELCLPLLRQKPAGCEQGRSYTPGEGDLKKGVFGNSPAPTIAGGWYASQNPSWHQPESRAPCFILAQKPGSHGMPGWEWHKAFRSSGLDEQDPRQELKEIMSFIPPLCVPDYVSKSGSSGFVELLAWVYLFWCSCGVHFVPLHLNV